MKFIFTISLFLILSPLLTRAAIWTSTDGKEVEARVIRVNPDRTVVLKTYRGKVVTVPFSAFIAADIAELERLLALPFTPHPVTWQEMNALFGIELWKDPLLWDDPTEEAAQRMQLKLESKTDFMENHRSYPLGEASVLTEPVYTTVLYGGKEHVESLSFVFLNQGDIKLPPEQNGSRREINPDLLEEMAEKIEASGMRVHDVLKPVLGEPRRDTLGKGNLREKVWRWDWNTHAIMLTMQEGKYAALRIMPIERAERAGRMEKLKENELKERMASCVERAANGDVLIGNIPMINQGPKGYCLPATYERYLRYIGIPADMYLLALAAGTGVGGGTTLYGMSDATGDLLSAHGRKSEYIGSMPEPNSIAEYIDQGLPIMWTFLSTPAFQAEVMKNTAQRNGKELKLKKNNAGQAEDTQENGHICLIIGYNRQTSEFAISDSWGPRFAVRWVPASAMRYATSDRMSVIKW
ncbi:C39 family peptidase [Pontiellaceae bacterium B12219]|nr:C39 family peptidase [Pontiellaceae bacterium B12219]